MDHYSFFFPDLHTHIHIYYYLECTIPRLHFINLQETNAYCQLIIFFLSLPNRSEVTWRHLSQNPWVVRLQRYTIYPLTLLKQADGIHNALCFPSPLPLLAFSRDRPADDTDPLWHFTLCSLIVAADSGTAHHTAAYSLFFPPFGCFSFFFFRGGAWDLLHCSHVAWWSEGFSRCSKTACGSIKLNVYLFFSLI